MKKETTVQSEIRLASKEDGVSLLRQNSGVLMDRFGTPVRFGLANESKAMNERYKSGDLVGLVPLVIRPDHVGQTLGIFTSIEVKREGWHFTGNGRETAQNNWAIWVRERGGFAGFASSVDEARMIWRKTGAQSPNKPRSFK